MIVLGIETATAQVGIALVDGDGPVATFTATRDRRHAETLVPAIRQLADTTGVSLDDVDGIAVDVGPGLFTGLRVGLATASTLGFALDVPVVGVSSLDVLARSATTVMAVAGVDCTAVVDARRGELFVRRFGIDGPVDEPRVAAPDEVISGLYAGHLVVGDGAHRHRDAFEAAGAVVVGDAWPSPVEVGLAGRELLQTPAPWPEPAPLYLRRPDAVANWTSVSSERGATS